MFPKYTGVITSLVLALLVIVAGMGYYHEAKELKEIDDRGVVMRVYSVKEATTDSKGMYDQLILENGEKIPATVQSIEEYGLKSPVNKIKPNTTEKSLIHTLLEKKMLKDK